MSFDLPSHLEYNGVKIDLGAESADRVQRAIDYLLPYGFGKSLQDSVAGVKKAMTAEGATPADIAAAIAAAMAERAEAIFAGTIGARGPRLVGPDAIRRDVIAEFFRAWAKRQADLGKGSLPSLKSRFNVSAKDATDEQKKAVAEAIAAIRDRYTKANAAKIEEEVERRLALQSAMVEDEIELELDPVDSDEDDESGE